VGISVGWTVGAAEGEASHPPLQLLSLANRVSDGRRQWSVKDGLEVSENGLAGMVRMLGRNCLSGDFVIILRIKILSSCSTGVATYKKGVFSRILLVELGTASVKSVILST